MKKNISINLFGTLYNIDEDAYELLDRYMESVKRYFNREGGEDITDDIEHRIAELLWERREQGQQAIDVQTVRDIISKIGSPSDIDDGTAAHDSHAHTAEEPLGGSAFAGSRQQSAQGRESSAHQGEQKFSAWMDEQGARLRGHFRGRRLYRDPDDKVLGGICSGFAQYIGGSDPLPWRLLMVFLFFCTRLSVGIIYLILWLLVPEARTPEERLRMRGCPVTPENLNQEILRQSEPDQDSDNSRKVWITVLVILFILSFIVPIVFGGWFLTHGLGFMSHFMDFMTKTWS